MDIKALLDPQEGQLKPSYKKALGYFYQKKYERCLDLISAEIPNHSKGYEFYRLWIEVLAIKKQFSSLRILSKHLSTLASTFADKTWLALKGLCLLELDEMEGASFFGSALAKEDNYYAQEFVGKLRFRRNVSASPFLVKAQGPQAPLKDFFHVDTLLRHLYLRKAPMYIPILERVLTKRFNAKLWVKNIKMQGAFAGHHGKEALHYAKECRKLAPKDPEFHFFEGLGLLYAAKFERAYAAFSRAIKRSKPLDGEVVYLRGYTAFQLSQSHPEYWERSLKDYKKAYRLMRQSGMAIRDVKNAISYLESKGEFHQSTEHEPKIHISVLSPRRSLEVKNVKGDDYLYYDLGRNALEGDSVFMCEGHGDKLKLVAIYSVVHHPIYHPVFGFETPLERSDLFLRPVEFELDASWLLKVAGRPGLFRLNESGLAGIGELLTASFAQNQKTIKKEA